MRSRVTLLSRALAVVAALLVVVVTAPPSFAAPTLTISQTEGLQDGQSVTISGVGFEPNMSNIAIGQCVEGYKGPADCNTAGGAAFKVADGSGKVAQFSVVVKQSFGAHDCTKVQCVIAAGPLPTAVDQATVDANTYVAKISFGSAAEQPTAAPTTEPPASTTPPGEALPKTGAGDSVPVLMLGASALVLAGVGGMLLLPGRRKGSHA